MTMTPDVNMSVVDFKNTKLKEMVTINDDGSYTIFINARFSQEEQMKAYKHAMHHIDCSDFWKSDVQEIEQEAHCG